MITGTTISAGSQEVVMTYPISRADLSVATAGTRERGELRDRDAPLTAAHQAIPTPGPVPHKTRVHGVAPHCSSEGTAWRKAMDTLNIIVSFPCGMGMDTGRLSTKYVQYVHLDSGHSSF